MTQTPTVQEAILALTPRSISGLQRSQIVFYTAVLKEAALPNRSILDHLAIINRSIMREDDKLEMQKRIITEGQLCANEHEFREFQRISKIMDDYLDMAPRQRWNWEKLASKNHTTESFYEEWEPIVSSLVWYHEERRIPLLPASAAIDHFTRDTRDLIPPRKLAKMEIRNTLHEGFDALFNCLQGILGGNTNHLAPVIEKLEEQYSAEEMRFLRSLRSIANNNSLAHEDAQDAILDHGTTVTWEQLIRFAALVEEYNLEWATASFDWEEE